MITLSARISDELAEQLEELFCELVRSNWTLYQQPAEETWLLCGYFESAVEAAGAWQELRELCPQLPANPKEETLEDADWKEAYKLHFHPWTDRDLHWVPVWEKETYIVPEGHYVIWLDPGMAFGTGNHETTRLCAHRLLDYRDTLAVGPAGRLSEVTVYDAGCGSGILALSAARLGFTNVVAFDRDPEAVTVSHENAERNELTGKVRIFEGDLESGLQENCADLILANIQADVLTIYANNLFGATRPGGTLAMSGILAEEVEALRETLKPVAKELWGDADPVETDIRLDGKWADLCFSRLPDKR